MIGFQYNTTEPLQLRIEPIGALTRTILEESLRDTKDIAVTLPFLYIIMVRPHFVKIELRFARP